MTRKVRRSLKKHEALVQSGKISSFTVQINDHGIEIRTDKTGAVQDIPLIDEILSPLKVFFFDVEAIQYGTFDYANLKSFLNAQTE